MALLFKSRATNYKKRQAWEFLQYENNHVYFLKYVNYRSQGKQQSRPEQDKTLPTLVQFSLFHKFSI